MAECPDSSLWPDVTSLVDGDKVNAEVFNTPLQQLAARTEHLLRLLGQVDRNKVSVTNAEFTGPDSDSLPAVGQVVYRTDDGAYALARGDAGNGEWFYAAQNAMAVGVVGDISGSTGTVVLCGFVSFGGGIPVADVIADANPASGRYYLSNVVAGKLTAGPSGPIIYVCDCHIENGMVTSMIVSPQYRDTGESHIHRSFALDWKPQGGYDKAVDGKYRVYGILPDAAASAPGGVDVSKVLQLHVCGAWDTDSSVAYKFELVASTPGSSSWDQYSMTCKVNGSVIWTQSLQGLSGSSTRVGPFAVGDNKMKVYLERDGGLTPDTAISNGPEWSVTMPDAGRGWLPSPDDDGFILNLGMYPAMSRFVPLIPSNSGALVVGGVELRGEEFGSACRWRIYPTVADDDEDAALPKGGPWLKWIGNDVVGDGTSATTPWDHDSSGNPSVRYIVLHAGRMRVGPTGFVTSLQPAKGSPIRITSALTDMDAVQGALQVGLDVDFRSSEGNAPGFHVVKRINGTEFITGPVVERIVAGPGLSVNQEQGTVRISASNAVYAGDFETIALRNAKQDLAGGVFPYTKLLGWGTGNNIDSGFTAKFRVPDHIPYNARGYYVVVSASVFGEAAGTGDATASFKLTNYTLGDQACSPDAAGAFDGSVATPDKGAEATVGVAFSGPYIAFDPVLVHGFRSSDGVAGPGQLVLPDTAQRKSVGALWLKSGAAGNPPVVVYPGYFVGLAIQRCATSGTAYTAPIGFMSLRWNLVEVPAS